eukprot:43428-Eustigmatos_ZCMA.PRE.1
MSRSSQRAQRRRRRLKRMLRRAHVGVRPAQAAVRPWRLKLPQHARGPSHTLLLLRHQHHPRPRPPPPHRSTMSRMH